MKFVYKTTHLPTGKIYIGQHDGRIDDGYIGSGVNIVEQIKRDKENPNWKSFYSRDILFIADNQQQLNAMEVYYINKLHSYEPNIGFNIKRTINFPRGGKLTPAHRAKCGQHSKGVAKTEEHKRKIAENQSGELCRWYGTIWITNYKVNKRIRADEPIPKGFTRGKVNQSDVNNILV